MKIDIQLNSRVNDDGQWMPKADIFIHEGNQTRCIPWEWWDQEFDSREAADRHARFNAIQKLIRDGYPKEIIFLRSSHKNST